MPFVRSPRNLEEKFGDFYTKWRDAQRSHIDKLRAALEGDTLDEAELARIVDEVKSHYELYYNTKTRADRDDVVPMLVPSWRTPLEKALMWVGGWRPTMSFHLVYALTGQKDVLLKSSSELDGVLAPSMEPLCGRQVERVVALHKSTMAAEESLTYRLAELQQSVGDEPMLSLAEAEMQKQRGDEVCAARTETGPRSMAEAVDEKLKVMEELLVEADELRRRTLQELLKVFTVVQAAQYLLGAAQLDMVISKLGQLKA